MLWANENLEFVYDGRPYTDSRGTNYPANFPRQHIYGLTQVQETERPTEPDLVVTGYTCSPQFVQVWQTRQRTAEDDARDRANKLDMLADVRYQKEVGGIDINGTIIQTDRDSRSNLMGARILAKEDANYSVVWKTDTGFVSLGAANIIGIADAVGVHVRRCFAAESYVAQVIDDYTTREEIEEAFNDAY